MADIPPMTRENAARALVWSRVCGKGYRLDKPLTKIYTMLVGINRVDSICTEHRFLATIHDVNPLASDSTF